MITLDKLTDHFAKTGWTEEPRSRHWYFGIKGTGTLTSGTVYPKEDGSFGWYTSLANGDAPYATAQVAMLAASKAIADLVLTIAKAIPPEPRRMLVPLFVGLHPAQVLELMQMNGFTFDSTECPVKLTEPSRIIEKGDHIVYEQEVRS